MKASRPPPAGGCVSAGSGVMRAAVADAVPEAPTAVAFEAGVDWGDEVAKEVDDEAAVPANPAVEPAASAAIDAHAPASHARRLSECAARETRALRVSRRGRTRACRVFVSAIGAPDRVR